MKKFTAIFAALFFAPSALAATLSAEFPVEFDKQETRLIAPLTVTSEVDGDIRSEHDLAVMLDPFEEVLWDDDGLTLSGTAVDNGRVMADVDYYYTDDYKSLIVPVKEDFKAGESLKIEGLMMRTYDHSFGNRYYWLDVDGDGDADVQGTNTYEVRDRDTSDTTPPYPVTNTGYEVNEDGSVLLIWNNPPDYDLDGVRIERQIVDEPLKFFTISFSEDFTDDSIPDGTEDITYFLSSYDIHGNYSDSVELIINLTSAEQETPGGDETPPETPEEPTEPSEPVQEPEAPADQSELDELSRLLNYYKVRYAIKCMPGGEPVAQNDYACLWARIDLVYAQEMLDEEPDAEITDYDKNLMEKRRVYSSARYQENCVEAQDPLFYCPALGKALDRVSYFVD
jgi:hypothetical protein